MVYICRWPCCSIRFYARSPFVLTYGYYANLKREITFVVHHVELLFDRRRCITCLQ